VAGVTDWQRLQQLDAEKRAQQYGFRAEIITVGLFHAPQQLQVQGAQVIRWGGDVFDVAPWRVYLSPWTPKPEIEANATDDLIVADLADPFVPGLNVEQFVAQQGKLQLYAKVIWGSGGARQLAFVDWPVGGMLLQVSGNYVEVDVIAISYSYAEMVPDLTQYTKLPDVTGTLAPEPGGGDSARAATFTYPLQTRDWNAQDGINFPIPPFARSVYFVWNNAGPVDDATNYATSARIIFFHANSTTDIEGEYIYDFTAGAIGDPREGIPIPARAAYVRVVPVFPVGPPPPDPPTFDVGATFELDL